MTGSETLTKLLSNLSRTSPDIEAAAVVDIDGLMMASALPIGSEEDSVAAMSAATLGMSERIVTELGRGEFELALVRSSSGYIILTRCGREAVLTVLASANAKLGLIFITITRTAKEIAKILDEGASI